VYGVASVAWCLESCSCVSVVRWLLPSFLPSFQHVELAGTRHRLGSHHGGVLALHASSTSPEPSRNHRACCSNELLTVRVCARTTARRRSTGCERTRQPALAAGLSTPAIRARDRVQRQVRPGLLGAHDWFPIECRGRPRVRRGTASVPRPTRLHRACIPRPRRQSGGGSSSSHPVLSCSQPTQPSTEMRDGVRVCVAILLQGQGACALVHRSAQGTLSLPHSPARALSTDLPTYQCCRVNIPPRLYLSCSVVVAAVVSLAYALAIGSTALLLPLVPTELHLRRRTDPRVADGRAFAHRVPSLLYVRPRITRDFQWPSSSP